MKPVLVDINKKNFVIDENLIEEKNNKKDKSNPRCTFIWISL